MNRARIRLTVLCICSIALGNGIPHRQAGADDDRDAAKEVDGFGAETNGLRVRLVAVNHQVDDEDPRSAHPTGEFASDQHLTFTVELRNVGDKSVTLLGVRYGENYPTAKGRLHASFFAPHLFEFDFTGADGERIPRAKRAYASDTFVLDGVSTHDLEPDESLTVVLRPGQFTAPMNYALDSGHYHASVRYRGPSKNLIDRIKKHWPDKPHLKAWRGEAASNSVEFAISADPNAAKKTPLNWGPAVDGLRAAVEFRVPDHVKGTPSDLPGIPLKTATRVLFHVQNVSESPITFASETNRQGDTIHVTDANGEKVDIKGTWFSGWPIDVRWHLDPGDVAVLSLLTPGVGSIAKPGMYTVRYTIRFNSRQQKDKDGNIVFPKPADYQSELDTGEALLFYRERTPEDDARAKPPSFSSRVSFLDESGAPVDSGRFTYRGKLKHKDHADRELTGSPCEIPECTNSPATISVRAPGFQEAVFHNLTFKPDETLELKLKRALPTRFRLVSTLDQKPVAGASVRYFNATSAKASSGPYPTKGIEGPIWTTSGKDGKVTLDSLQTINPIYEKLGDVIYFFYVEPTQADLAPRFVGPLKAGQELGDIPLGPTLEIQGEVQGTAEELGRFSAEWDQPIEMTSENPDATWTYAVSQRLKTKRVGDKLTFHLKGLRPGKLRFISNFGPRPHSVSHTYARRDPKGSDRVVELDLDKSFIGLVINSQTGTRADEPEPADEVEETADETVVIKESLDQSVSFDVSERPFFAVLSEIESHHGVPVTLSLARLHAIGISARTKISLHVDKRPLREAIDRLMLAAGTTAEITDEGVMIPAKTTRIVVKYEMPDTEKETRIYVQHIGGRGDIGTVEQAMSKWSPLKNGETLDLTDLDAGDYQVARLRRVDAASAGPGRMMQELFLDRRKFSLKSGQSKTVNYSRAAARKVAGTLVGFVESKVETAIVTICSENAVDEDATLSLDVVMFDALNCEADGSFETEPLSPGKYVAIVSAYAPLTKEQTRTTGIPQPTFTGRQAFTVAANGKTQKVAIRLNKRE